MNQVKFVQDSFKKNYENVQKLNIGLKWVNNGELFSHPQYAKSYGIKYSRVDQIKFVEDSL